MPLADQVYLPAISALASLGQIHAVSSGYISRIPVLGQIHYPPHTNITVLLEHPKYWTLHDHPGTQNTPDSTTAMLHTLGAYFQYTPHKFVNEKRTLQSKLGQD